MARSECAKWAQDLEARGYESLIEAVYRRARARGIQRSLALKAERDRLKRCLFYEMDVRAQGYLRVAGVDEVGRGPLAGPVAAAAVILKGELLLPCLDDSKCLNAVTRGTLFDLIGFETEALAVSLVDVAFIDRYNILRATQEAMRRAIWSLPEPPDFVLVDGLCIPDLGTAQRAIVKGDALSGSISAASIMAKVIRDRYMVARARDFPHYAFDKNKGYGTPEHWEALRIHGPCTLHRRSFLGRME